MTGALPEGPPPDCQVCPRLATFRETNRSSLPDFFNAPVPSFGDVAGRLLIVGLAPGLKGANRTGRPFTGDFAGDLLYETLQKFGLARGRYDKRPDDGLELVVGYFSLGEIVRGPLNSAYLGYWASQAWAGAKSGSRRTACGFRRKRPTLGIRSRFLLRQ